jgi:hypothetical protein
MIESRGGHTVEGPNQEIGEAFEVLNGLEAVPDKLLTSILRTGPRNFAWEIVVQARSFQIQPPYDV